MKDGILALVTMKPTKAPSRRADEQRREEPESDHPSGVSVGVGRRNPAHHDPAGDRRRQSNHGADRNVEFAGDHDDGHTGGDDQHHRHLPEQIADIGRREEAFVGDLHGDDEQQQDAQRLDEAIGAL